jgi:hypothetical protein
MFETLNKTLATARALGIPESDFRQVGPTRWKGVLEGILTSITRRGCSNLDLWWLWEDFLDPFLVVEPPLTEDLQRLRALGPPSTQIFLLVEDQSGEKQVGCHWIVEATLDSALAVLGELPFLEFYLVARDMSWAVAENHHNMWIGVGSHAIEVLQGMEAETTD